MFSLPKIIVMRRVVITVLDVIDKFSPTLEITFLSVQFKSRINRVFDIYSDTPN